MRDRTGIGFWRRPEKVLRKFVKVQYCSLPAITLLVIISVALLPSLAHSFGSSNRRPPPPRSSDRQPSAGPGPSNNQPGPPPHHQSIRRQGLPFEGGPPAQSGNNNNNNAPIGHRRIQSHPHGPPPPHHGKHRGRPPFPFPRRRPPPPPPRGRGPPPRDRERERDSDNNGPRGRPPFKPQPPSDTPPKLSFHIPPAPLTSPQPPHPQDNFQQRPPHNGPQGSEPQQNGFPQFQQNPQPNVANQPQFHQQLQQQQHQLQQQTSQFSQLNNGNPFQNQPPQFPNNQQHLSQNQFGASPILLPTGYPQGQPGSPPIGFQQGPPAGVPTGFPQSPSAGPPSGFPQGPSAVPPTAFQPGPSAIPPTHGFPQQQPPQQQQGPHPSHMEHPHQPQMHPSQLPSFNNNQQQAFPQHPVFGQINPSLATGSPNPHVANNNPNNPPILEYAPPPNTFQSTPQPDVNILQDKSKEIELNSIPKQTITFTVTPKPSKTGGTQLHFKISTPKPFKTTLKPLTNSKGYFKGSTYRPPVDKLTTKFKYSNSNSNMGYPDAEYRPQDGSRRESSMSAEMEPPSDQPRDSIKDLMLNRAHSLNHPSGPHPDDTDNYAGPSYEAPPVFVKPISGEQVLIAGITDGKTSYHKGHHTDDFHGPSNGPHFEDYDNGALGVPHQERHPFGDDDDMGSNSYSDRHLHSFGPNKDNGFDEYSNGKTRDELFRRPSLSGSHEENFGEFEHGHKTRPSLHIDEESLVGSGEGKRGNHRHGEKFSQPDPLYHPEEDGGSSLSKERENDNGDEFGEKGRYDGFSSSGERRHKERRKEGNKSATEELLAALGLSTNPLVSMPNSKYGVDIPTKYSSLGSLEKDYNPESDHKRNKNAENRGAGSSGEPMGLHEYLHQKESEQGGIPQNHATEPLYSVPDRQIGGSAENSFVVKGSMRTGSGSGEKSEMVQDIRKVPSSIIVGRPIPQYQGSEPDIITKQTNPLAHSSYIEQKMKGNADFYGNPTGQESYLYDKIHGANGKPHHLDSHHGQSQNLPLINSGLYGPSVPPPISEPGTFTNNPPIPVLSSPAAPVVQGSPLLQAQTAASGVPQQPQILNPVSHAGAESYLYQKIHGTKQTGLSFGPTPPSPHSVEDQSGLYNPQQLHPQSGLYASPSEQIAALSSGQPSPSGLVYSHGNVINPQQQQQQHTIGNGVLLPLGMGGVQQPTGLAASNVIPVQGPHQKQPSQQFIGQQQLSQLIPGSLQQPLVPQSSPQLPTVLLPQQSPQLNQQQILAPQTPQGIQLQPPHLQQQPGLPFQAPGGQVPSLPQQPLQGQHSQQMPQIVPAPAPQQHGHLYGPTGNEQVDRIAQAPHYSGEVSHPHHQQPNVPHYQQHPALLQQQQQQQLHGQVQSQHIPGNLYGQPGHLQAGQIPYNQFAQPQQPIDPTLAGSNLNPTHAVPHQQYAAGSAVTARYGEAYPVYVTEPDPIIEIIVQDSNMTLPPMPTFPPPPPPPPPTPEPVHVFYVKYSQKNNTPVFDNYYGQSNPQVQLEQPISSVPVRGPDRNGMLPVDDTRDSLPQSSIQHQSIYNNVYSTSTESSVSTTPAPSTTTTLRTIIRPDRNEFAHGGSGLVVSFDNPAVEHDIFANYTQNLIQQQQQHQQQIQQQLQQHQHQQQIQQQQQQQIQHQLQQQLHQQGEQRAPQFNHEQHQQQQPHAYPEITFPPQQQYQQFGQQQEVHQQQQQAYPSLDSLWGSLTSEQKSAMEQQQQQQQQEASQAAMYQGFNKRIGLQELASLLEASPPSGTENQQGEQKAPEHVNENINLQDYHSMHPNTYSGNNDEQNPPPLYQYVESSHHQSPRQAKLPDDVPEELRNQLVQSGILGNAEVQVINYSENLFKELGDLPPEAMAAFQAHTGNMPQNKQLDTEKSASPSSLEQSVWSGSQVSLANADLSTLLPSGRSLRSILVVKNSLRPKRGGRQRRVVLLITDKNDVLLYRPKDRSLKRIGTTTSNSVIKGAIELSNHRMEDDESVDLVNQQKGSA